ncbi:MAG TPA: hypothetical protein VK661_11160 [Planctomycetota bacterium]|nr:hypothetical protein [Planctomycetota bacterium]
MRNLIRAIARLPRRRLRLLIRASRIEAVITRLETRLKSARKEKSSLEAKEARLERRVAGEERKLESVLAGAGVSGRGPGRPPKRRGPGRPPKARRGPGRPPKRRGPGRPPKAGASRRRRRRINEKPLALALRDILAQKSQPMAVAELADLVRRQGYKTKSKPSIFAITVSLALRKHPEIFVRTGRKYQMAKSAAPSN